MRRRRSAYNARAALATMREEKVKVTVHMPLELYEKLRACSPYISKFIVEAVREKVERELALAPFRALPLPVRDKLLEAAGGDEYQAAQLYAKLLDKALGELEQPAKPERLKPSEHQLQPRPF